MNQLVVLADNALQPVLVKQDFCKQFSDITLKVITVHVLVSAVPRAFAGVRIAAVGYVQRLVPAAVHSVSAVAVAA